MQYRVFEYAVDVVRGKLALAEVPIRFRADVANLIENQTDLLEFVRNKKWEEIKELRDYKETAGLPYKDKVFDYDMRSAFKLSVALEAGKAVGDTFKINWTMQDNSTMELTLEDLVNVPLVAAQYSNSLHEQARALYDKIYAETDVVTIINLTWN